MFELENWINEVIEQKTNGHDDKTPTGIRSGLHNSMKADAQFHRAVADMLDDKEDVTLIKYHMLMERIHKSICN